ncbi:hypothetical protein BP422_08655 [Brevibacillus formosus]|uniref:Uncharacterized protein n=1 Tax=Brevibacillus formosus TaxID=54913 RepID=A0A220MF87_9BACL|nr:hypothetical protein [Brevibacillus formosus]ASJ53622.1 hypothetical protein BP422_08655 [Brevibacillus formosus]
MIQDLSEIFSSQPLIKKILRKKWKRTFMVRASFLQNDPNMPVKLVDELFGEKVKTALGKLPGTVIVDAGYGGI